MIKQPVIDIATTNIAALGTDAELQARINASNHEAAWTAAGHAEGVEVWRIEQFKVVPWPKEQYGQFTSGDAFIVLKTYRANPDSEKLSYNLHFWIGKDATADEAGTAAYKTVELDDHLHGVPVQYREIQGYESSLFTKIFPRVQFLDGGVASGFKSVVEESIEPRLLHVKGTARNMVVRQVPLAIASLNAGDVFVLDTGKHRIIQWNGARSSPFEKAKAAELVQAMEGERHGRAQGIVVVSWRDRCDSGIAEPTSDATTAPATPTALYRISDASGTLTFTPIKTDGGVTRANLESHDAFVVDGGHTIVVWVGNDASAAERSQGVAIAEQFLDSQGRSKLVRIVRVVEGGASPLLDKLLD
ncbi:hypothetical protein AMAG_06037 [Allomyces macrogynus ATCC 38327]|uniref:Gelsolin-like domain-containing protein n=1 Tax=Allomyces macrogynus (strain ATCC 38327) TaxID=578462 RepID=A0A0L0SDV6_ALLM3|nr:hypothetical protein AMAG_06037 [Allomyces macrogynus ATCC 38327]|eukprot:KNE60666.1 hypothetical protein AMAG_06037 [Allomyces macrogynus ATCC 38327]